MINDKTCPKNRRPIQLLENKETDHQSDRFTEATGSSIKRPEAILEHLPRNDLGQSEKMVSRVELIKQIRAKEAALAVRFFRLHF